jgi:hypothetical protein
MPIPPEKNHLYCGDFPMLWQPLWGKSKSKNEKSKMKNERIKINYNSERGGFSSYF